MSSKLKYLKRYGYKKEVKKRKDPLSHLHVVDDDINWKSTIVDDNQDLECDDNSDEAPLVAEVRDESKIKWQPLPGATVDKLVEDNSTGVDLSPPRGRISGEFQSDNQRESKRLKNSFRKRSEDGGNSPPRKYASTTYKSEIKKYKDGDKISQNVDTEEDISRKQEFIEWGRG